MSEHSTSSTKPISLFASGTAAGNRNESDTRLSVVDTTQADPRKPAPVDQRLVKRLSGLAINEEGFAFDPHTGESFTVNLSGREIIQALTAGKDEEVIARELSESYVIDLREARRDLRDFMEQLRVLRLVGEVE